MKIIVAGSRDITDYKIVDDALCQSGWIDGESEIVSGMARGVDTLAVEFAKNHDLPLRKFPANWDKYGKMAGIFRNEDMAKFADALVAIWDGKSRGTKNMIDFARHYKLKIFIKRTDIDNFSYRVNTEYYEI